EPLAGRILREAARRRGLVLDYFREVIGPARRVALVDIGWKGRLQLCLSRIFAADDELKDVDLRGLYFRLTRPNGADAATFGRCPKIAHSVLLEVLASADHGSVEGYRRETNGAVVAIFEPVDAAAVRWGVHDLQAGAVTFTERLRANAKHGHIDLAR